MMVLNCVFLWKYLHCSFHFVMSDFMKIIHVNYLSVMIYSFFSCMPIETYFGKWLSWSELYISSWLSPTCICLYVFLLNKINMIKNDSFIVSLCIMQSIWVLLLYVLYFLPVCTTCTTEKCILLHSCVWDCWIYESMVLLNPARLGTFSIE